MTVRLSYNVHGFENDFTETFESSAEALKFCEELKAQFIDIVDDSIYVYDEKNNVFMKRESFQLHG